LATQVDVSGGQEVVCDADAGPLTQNVEIKNQKPVWRRAGVVSLALLLLPWQLVADQFSAKRSTIRSTEAPTLVVSTGGVSGCRRGDLKPHPL
jgi:hypothetical protein